MPPKLSRGQRYALTMRVKEYLVPMAGLSSLCMLRCCDLQGPGVLAAVAGPCAALFCGILHREILMDLNDVDGDRENGVRTVPVVLGKGPALAVAAGLAAACVCAAGAVLALNPGPGFLVSTHLALVTRLCLDSVCTNRC